MLVIKKQYIYENFWTNCPEVKIEYETRKRAVKVCLAALLAYKMEDHRNTGD